MSTNGLLTECHLNTGQKKDDHWNVGPVFKFLYVCLMNLHKELCVSYYFFNIKNKDLCYFIKEKPS